MMDLEVSEKIGADRYERTDGRDGCRDGCQPCVGMGVNHV